MPKVKSQLTSVTKPAPKRRSAAKPKSYTFPLVIERDEDGYFVSCLSLQGCYVQGDTYEEAMQNITDAVKLHIEDRLAGDEPIPVAQSVSVTLLEVAA